MDLSVCSTPTPIQPTPASSISIPPTTVPAPQPPSLPTPLEDQLPPLTSSYPLSASTTTSSLPSPYQQTLPPSPLTPTNTTHHDDLLEPALGQQQQQQQQQHTDDKDDRAQSIPFKVWRSQHMATSGSENDHHQPDCDDHDNIPIDAPLPSTQREKHLRKTQRDIQLQHYRSRCIKEFRQRRQLRCGRQEIASDDDNGDDDDTPSPKRQRIDNGRHVRFIVPPKFKRGSSSTN
ncbi:hypothetical protein BCR42DRAFT_426425 [Absidia repens]|uniref:Uncharacterized protein n=1 Tax=Absidia repens TaxID=90262 RepID=A0A1X2I140_9FUNG|nr:hypothetical protein BCR42DRAFT_426425 [Absidia repens]